MADEGNYKEGNRRSGLLRVDAAREFLVFDTRARTKLTQVTFKLFQHCGSDMQRTQGVKYTSPVSHSTVSTLFHLHLLSQSRTRKTKVERHLPD
jgi:hypothetical protein